jgi:hypothetical protein
MARTTTEEVDERKASGPVSAANENEARIFVQLGGSNGDLIAKFSPPTQELKRAARQLELFAHRCFDFSDQVAAGKVDFLDAVDVLQDAAVASGLEAAVGMDVVQAVMGTAFAHRRLA